MRSIVIYHIYLDPDSVTNRLVDTVLLIIELIKAMSYTVDLDKIQFCVDISQYIKGGIGIGKQDEVNMLLICIKLLLYISDTKHIHILVGNVIIGQPAEYSAGKQGGSSAQ